MCVPIAQISNYKNKLRCYNLPEFKCYFSEQIFSEKKHFSEYAMFKLVLVVVNIYQNLLLQKSNIDWIYRSNNYYINISSIHYYIKYKYFYRKKSLTP